MAEEDTSQKQFLQLLKSVVDLSGCTTATLGALQGFAIRDAEISQRHIDSLNDRLQKALQGIDNLLKDIAEDA